MKKRYVSPTVKCIELGACTLLTGSLDSPKMLRGTRIFGSNQDVGSTLSIECGGDGDGSGI